MLDTEPRPERCAEELADWIRRYSHIIAIILQLTVQCEKSDTEHGKHACVKNVMLQRRRFYPFPGNFSRLLVTLQTCTGAVVCREQLDFNAEPPWDPS
ncbi:hypothetical protein PGIGA_G00132290 [Pangasianodon gigas]|uniref:Uncharacterized protein n=1 Tax=Pangasianodon gigas TaxID=30993 RepID=A0ACC5XJJ5_PANGG|nr:hypothetical protein [Pangasianodon gigas]